MTFFVAMGFFTTISQHVHYITLFIIYIITYMDPKGGSLDFTVLTENFKVCGCWVLLPLSLEIYIHNIETQNY